MKCLGCDKWFYIAHDTSDQIDYCPFCGQELDVVGWEEDGEGR